MKEQFARTALLTTENGMNNLLNARVAVFGVGGVGGHVVEALARSGVGKIDIIDDDEVALSNINRQIIAVHSTVGIHKVDVMKNRILDINPDIEVVTHKCFFMPENADNFDFSSYDYVVDAIDTVTAKIELVMRCNNTNTPLISSMGTGNKLNPTLFEVSDIHKTSVCPLARIMRQELKKRNIKKLKVVYSKEEPIKVSEKPLETMPDTPLRSGAKKRSTPGSTAFCPSVAGLIIASEVFKDLTV